MADIALEWVEFEASMLVQNNDLGVDEGLQTAIIISLFTDGQALESDLLPYGESFRRGFWGDALAEIEGDKIGSKLWLLSREKQMPVILRKAEEFAREALKWLIDDKVATDYSVVATNPAMGILLLDISITRPVGNAITFRYNYNWAAQAVKGA